MKIFFILNILILLFLATNSVAKSLDKKKLELKKAFEAGAISKIEYNKSLDFLSNSDNEKKEKKLLINKKSKKSLLQIIKDKKKEKDKEKEKITLKKIEELGPIIKFDNTYLAKGMLKELPGCKTSFKCQGEKAGSYLYKAFNRSKAYSQKNPGQMIKAMAMYEVFYAQKLWQAKDKIKRFKENKYKSSFMWKTEDEKEIRSLLGINKGRKSMREALGMNMETPQKDAINKFWLLGTFLDLGTGVNNEKLSKDLKERQEKLANYKSEIVNLKKKLQEDIDKEEEENENSVQ